MQYPLKTATLAVAAVFPLFIPSAHAQDGLEPVVVTATRQEQRIQDVLASVEVIDREQIERAGQSTLVELLRSVSGVRVSAEGGPGSSSSVFIRGAESRHTLLLIDGVRAGSATVGQPALETIPLALIERIEVLRGPASVLYGSEAIGGVIQVFTRKGVEGIYPELFVGVGSNRTLNMNASLTGGVDRLSYNLTAGRDRTDGFNARRDRAYWNSPGSFGVYDPDRDGFDNRYVNASASLGFRKRDEIGASFYHTDGRNEYDRNTFDNVYIDKKLSSGNVHMRNELTKNWTSTLRVGQSRDSMRDHSAPGVSELFRTRQTQFMWQNDIALPVGKLLAAYEHLRQKVDSETDYVRDKRTLRAWMLGWSAGVNRHSVRINVRHDHNSQFGSETTGLLAYGYKLSDEWNMRGSIGSAFNAPNFNQLYWPADIYGGGGNPELEPEKALNREIGVDWTRGLSRLELTYFNNNIKEMISGWPAQNINRARLEGVEIAFLTHLAGFDVHVGADFMRAEDRETGNRLARRSNRAAFIRLDRMQGAWQWGAEWNGEGHRYDDAANNIRLAGYGVVNAYAHYRFSPEWRLEMRANNIFDRDYELARGYSTGGTNVFAGLRYTPR